MTLLLKRGFTSLLEIDPKVCERRTPGRYYIASAQRSAHHRAMTIRLRLMVQGMLVPFLVASGSFAAAADISSAAANEAPRSVQATLDKMAAQIAALQADLSATKADLVKAEKHISAVEGAMIAAVRTAPKDSAIPKGTGRKKLTNFGSADDGKAGSPPPPCEPVPCDY